MRRLAPILVAACLLAAALLATSVSTASASAPNYLNLAQKGIYNARTHYWNPGEHWYNDRLNDGDAYPLATVWSIVPLFEALDGVQIAQPNDANRNAVRDFANYAERYWNGALLNYGGWSPYPGDHGVDACVFYDDNSWWGLAFLDAYRATGNKRYLDDAKKASDFVDARGWDGGGARGGMWWDDRMGDPNICRPSHSLEALAAASALAAGIYEQTNNDKYRAIAHKYLGWADAHAFSHHSGLYENRYLGNGGQAPLTYAEGSFIGAHLSLCRMGEKDSCKRMRRVAKASKQKWGPGDPNYKPQADTILMRYIAQLAVYDKNGNLWKWADRTAKSAINHAKVGSLYLRFWNGDYPPSRAPDMKYGQIQTHSSAVALFAWLAAFPRP